MASSKTETALDRFVEKTRALFAREADPERRWTQMAPLLAELLTDPAAVEASKIWPECNHVDNRPENLLFYEDPEYKFVINGLVVSRPDHYSGTTARIHDHGHIYTLYGLLDGHQRIERYERIDDGSKEGYAEIRKTVDSACGTGEIDLVRPYEIHAENTVGERAVAVIVRSESNAELLQGRYAPEEKRCWQGYGPRQTPVSFY